MTTRFALPALLVSVLGCAWPARAADLPQVYAHPAGFSLRLPGDWQVQKTDESVTLTPPGDQASRTFLLADPAQGLREPNDPQSLAGCMTVKGLARTCNAGTHGEAIATVSASVV